jgi:hypothetical protein
MTRLHERIQHAIELVIAGHLEQARQAIRDIEEPLAQQLAPSALTAARHDIGNALSIAKASIEAMLDGIVPITDARLNRIRSILVAVSDSMYELTPPDSKQDDGAPSKR